MRARRWALVLALIEGVIHGAYGEASGRDTSFPAFPTALVIRQVALMTVASSTRGFLAVLADNPHAGRVDMAFRVVATFEKFVTDGTLVPATLLLDGLSCSAWCFH